jgi:signal transduction histidine kinase
VNDPASPESEPQRIALLGHELRTPLNAIIGYAEAMTLEAFGPLPAPYGEHAATIHRAAIHLLTLVDDLTDQAQAESGVWAGHRTPFDPLTLTEDVASLLRPRAERNLITLAVTRGTGLRMAHGDRRAMRQILLNLLDNALKFTAQGGKITVEVSGEAANLRLDIRDTGGAAGEKGHGLGLRLVRALADAQGGAVEMTPIVGAGMDVSVRLPILTEA